MKMKQTLITVALGRCIAGAHASNLPLKTLPDDGERDHWLPSQVNREGKLEALQEVAGGPAVKFKGSQDKPIQIALIYPSADVSDFWARNYIALTKRLDELGSNTRPPNSPRVRLNTRCSRPMPRRWRRMPMFMTLSSSVLRTRHPGGQH